MAENQETKETKEKKDDYKGIAYYRKKRNEDRIIKSYIIFFYKCQTMKQDHQ